MIKGGGAKGSTVKTGSRVRVTNYPPPIPAVSPPKPFHVARPASWRGTNYPGGYKTVFR